MAYVSINIGATEDWADSYNETIYGGSGFVHRNPLLTPKPSYAMWATMTRLLDSAQYVRYLDTGSRSLYALEFQRTNAYVYPIWTVRGKRQLTVPVGAETVFLTDGMGNTTARMPSRGRVTLEATSSPMYLVTAARITNSISPGLAAYAEEPIVPPDSPAGSAGRQQRAIPWLLPHVPVKSACGGRVMKRWPLTALAVAGLGLSAARGMAEALYIQELDAIGQNPTNVAAIVGPRTLTFAAPQVGHALHLVGRLGEKTNALWKLTLGTATNTLATVSLISKGGAPLADETYKIYGPRYIDTNAMTQVSSPDVFMSLTASLPGPRLNCGTISYFLKPNLNFYVTNRNERAAVAARYPQFPSARTHVFTIRVEHADAGFDLWLDGRYLGIVPSSAGMTTGSVVLVASNELVCAYDWPALRSASYLPLDLAPLCPDGAPVAGFSRKYRV